jgi:hypothetical protein
MMIIAVFVRIKIEDNLIKILPALLYAVLNFIILYKSLIGWQLHSKSIYRKSSK